MLCGYGDNRSLFIGSHVNYWFGVSSMELRKTKVKWPDRKRSPAETALSTKFNLKNEVEWPRTVRRDIYNRDRRLILVLVIISPDFIWWQTEDIDKQTHRQIKTDMVNLQQKRYRQSKARRRYWRVWFIHGKRDTDRPRIKYRQIWFIHWKKDTDR